MNFFPYFSKSRITIEDLGNVNPSTRFHTKATSYLQIYSKFAFYLLISPYKVIYSESCTVEFQSSLWRKVLCGVLQALASSLIIYDGRSSFVLIRKIRQDPFQILNLLSIVTSIYSVLSLIYINWVQGNKGLKTLYISSFEHKEPNSLKPNKRLGWRANQAICLLPIITTMITISISVFSSSTSKVDLILQNPPSAFFSVVFNSSLCLIKAYSQLLSLYTVALAYIFCLVIHEIGCDFCDFLKMHPNALLKEIIQSYMDVKTLLETVNNSLSQIASAALVLGVSNFSNLIIVIDNGTVNDRIQIMLHLLAFSAFARLAAEANLKFGLLADFIFKNWQEHKYGNDPNVQIMLLEVSRNSLGMKASTFTVTYSFMATVRW